MNATVTIRLSMEPEQKYNQNKAWRLLDVNTITVLFRSNSAVAGHCECHKRSQVALVWCRNPRLIGHTCKLHVFRRKITKKSAADVLPFAAYAQNDLFSDSDRLVNFDAVPHVVDALLTLASTSESFSS